MSIRPFAEAANFTQIHNYVLDEIMPSLPPNAWKVLSLIIRKTKGWQKTYDKISYTRIMAGTGIAHPATVKTALEPLLARGYVVATAKGKWDAIEYRLNTEYEVASTSKIEAGVTSKIEVTSTSKIEVTKRHTKKTQQKKVESAQRALSTRARGQDQNPLRFNLTEKRRAWAERNTPEVLHKLDLEVRKLIEWCNRRRSKVLRITDKRFHSWLFKAVEFQQRDARVVFFERPQKTSSTEEGLDELRQLRERIAQGGRP